MITTMFGCAAKAELGNENRTQAAAQRIEIPPKPVWPFEESRCIELPQGLRKIRSLLALDEPAGKRRIVSPEIRAVEVMTSRAPIVAVLLAGGRSSRFGTDKSLAVLGGKTLVARVAERLAPQVDAMVISANGDPIRFAFLGLPVVSDREELGAFSGP